MRKIFWRIIFLATFVLTPLLVNAQHNYLQGLLVVDFLDSHPDGVFITNMNTKITSISDISGSFKIAAKVGDTLHFQSSFLVPRKFIVRESSFRMKPLVIHMNQEVISLEDMLVKKPLTGDLGKDIKSVKIREDVEKVYANLGVDIRILDMVPKEKKAKVIPSIAGIPVPTSLDVEALYKTFTGYYRRMENLDNFERLEKRFTDVTEYLGVSYFEKELQLEESDIREFLVYVYDHSDGLYESFYLQKDYLSLDYLFKQKNREFLKRIQERNKANSAAANS